MATFRLYGLTGGIASGKSTVGDFFRALGIPVVDADEIARDLRRPGGPAADAIQERFGTVERLELRKLIAEDPRAKKDLEGILHPRIAEESLARFAALAEAAARSRAAPRYGIYEAALLIEAGRAKDFAATILVESGHESQIDRLTRRDGMSPVEARRFLEMQRQSAVTPEEKRRLSRYRVQNDGTLDELRARVQRLHEELAREE